MPSTETTNTKPTSSKLQTIIMSHSSTSSQASASPPPSPRVSTITTSNPSSSNSSNKKQTICKCETLYRTYPNCSHQVPEQTWHAKDCKHYDENANGSCDGKATLSRIIVTLPAVDGDDDPVCPECRDQWVQERFRF